MARIELRGIAHSYLRTPTGDRDYAVKPVDLIWEEGGAYALLGPSGCGKTTLLGIMSGLVKPSRGSVWIGGRDVTELPPRLRNVAQVFQFPVIYDTMTVFDNLAFPLRNRGVASTEIQTRVGRVAELLDLSADLKRRASGLPGELKQRISLGRGLVRKDVAAILLDEPLTVIDPHLKWVLRRKLMEIHAELKVTLIYVTHDQLEALTLAEQVVVMNDGHVLQQGSPEALFERPAHVFVGHFIGSPGMNVLPCSLVDGALRVDGQPIALPDALVARAQAADRGTLQLGARPEFLTLTNDPAGPGGRTQVAVTRIATLGGFKLVTVRLGAHDVHVKVPVEYAGSVGSHAWLVFPASHTHLYLEGRVLAESAS
jgi:glycerol transport system ATP-binding protein